MYTKTIVASLIGAASIAAAAPTPQDTCTQFPWFIVPNTGTNCDGTAVESQPASGPAPGRNVTCSPLDQTGAGNTFPSVSANVACPDSYPYTLSFYTTSDCSDVPKTLTSGSACLTPEYLDASFISYQAVQTLIYY